jgi:ribonuclease HII
MSIIESVSGTGRLDWQSFGLTLVAGVDEVGRGCLAGDVYAAAVILRPEARLTGITDSKLIAPEKRLVLAERIKSESVCWAVGIAAVEEIEQINILRASLLAMKRAVESLSRKPELLLIDGDYGIQGEWLQKTVVKGDLRCKLIGAASILAKTARDLYMAELDEKYPGYHFAAHKGYGTPVHREAIRTLGPCAVHRKTFAGVREYCADGPVGREPGPQASRTPRL